MNPNESLNVRRWQKEANAELARRIIHLHVLARLHVSRNCTLRVSRELDGRMRIIITRPLGQGGRDQIVARGDYDEVLLQLTSGSWQLVDQKLAQRGGPQR